MIGPVVAAAAEGRDAVARTAHRRAVRAAGDHHARRGDHRHGRRRSTRSCTAPRAGRSTPRSSPSPASASSSRRGGRTSRSRGRRCCSCTASGRSRGATATSSSSAPLAAIGAGLHVAAYYLEHETTLGPTGTVLSTAIPVSIYVAALYGIYAAFTRASRPVPPLAAGGDGRRARALGRPRRAGRGGRRLPPRAHVRARRHGRRLRDARPPPRRRGSCADAADAHELSRDDAR